MLFDKNDGKANERILYQTKPNMLLGCKKAVYGIVLLIIILMLSPIVIKFIGQMQVYLISRVKLPLTSYTAIAFFVIILINVIYIIWQLVGWFSIEYTLTDTKIIIKSGVISTKKNYMPYSTIQDINTSQSIFARMFNVGSVSIFSAYDNNQMELKNISKEEFENSQIVLFYGYVSIFLYVNNERVYADNPRDDYFDRDNYTSADDYLGRNEVYDEYEPITPITHERNSYPRRDYEYYPEDFSNVSNQSRHNYEYEPYNNGFNNPQNSPHRESYYNQIREDYSHSDEEYYHNYEAPDNYNERVEEPVQDRQEDIDGSSQKAIQRHFDKFKR